MKRAYKILIFIILLITGLYTYLYIKEETTDYGHKVVVCIPVYGQSLALGEEANRVTDFKKLKNDYDGRILTENLDYDFGYLADKKWKLYLKKILHYQKRSFEISAYGMAESLARQLGNDTIICIFPRGQGATPISQLGKSSNPYNILLSDIRLAYNKARKRGWNFYVPAICWMQGESDITNYTGSRYKELLKRFCEDINVDIKGITHQCVPVRMICYQTNAITRAKDFDNKDFECVEAMVPQAIMELVRDDSLFWASGPTYPYSFAREAIHIDGISQKRIGSLEAISAIKIIRNQKHFNGLIPTSVTTNDYDIFIHYNVPCPPLKFDTTNVKAAPHYGYSVITPEGEDIISSVCIIDSIVKIKCSKYPIGNKVRYAINGEKMKSGFEHGPRGNLRDSQGDKAEVSVSNKRYPLHNWGVQFVFLLE